MTTANDLLCCPEFIELERRLNRFNVFEATDMGRREIKHTKFLAYLLDPNESHGLGDTFLHHFLIFLSGVNGESDIQIMNLSMSFARSIPEWGPPTNNNNRKIDLIVEIPFLSNGKTLVIAIENKIGAKQGEDQLAIYGKILNESPYSNEANYSIKKYFLTEQGEKPLDKEWTGIQYSETVIPAIEQTLKSCEGKISEYIKYVLNDYLNLLNSDDESDREIETLAREISIKDGLIGYLKTTDDATTQELRNLKTKYAKTCAYMVDFNDDIRKKILEWFRKIPDQKISIEGKDFHFNIESSNRNLLRFSIFSENNQIKTKEFSQNSHKQWLTSERCIAFEIGMARVKINDENNLRNDPKKLKVWATLVLGPTGIDAKYRTGLAIAIFKKIKNNLDAEERTGLETSTPEEAKSTNRAVADNSARLTRPNVWKKSRAEVIQHQNPARLENTFEQWVKNNLFSLEGKNNKIKLDDELTKIAIALNSALDDYRKPIDPPQT